MKKNNFFNMPEKIFGVSSSLIRLFFAPLGAVVFILTSIGWLIMPGFESMQSLKQSTDTLKDQVRSINEKRDYLLSIDQSKLKQNVDYLSSAVIPEKNSYLLLGVVKSIVEKYDYQIVSFSLSIEDLKDESGTLRVAEKKMATKLPLNIELSGPSDKFVNLINGLENSLPILFIDNLETKKKSENTDIKMLISSYYMADDTESNYDKLTLNDLKLSKEESDLLVKISEFDNNAVLGQFGGGGGAYVEHDRTNPF